MSDMPMTLPEEIADREDLKHAELFMFLPGEWNPCLLYTSLPMSI